MAHAKFPRINPSRSTQAHADRVAITEPQQSFVQQLTTQPQGYSNNDSETLDLAMAGHIGPMSSLPDTYQGTSAIPSHPTECMFSRIDSIFEETVAHMLSNPPLRIRRSA